MRASQTLSSLFVRSLIGLIAVALLVGCNGATSPTDAETNIDATATNNKQTSSPNVVSPDWGIASTLVAMGDTPVATGDVRIWEQWVGRPDLPASVKDLGTRYLPNAELIAQLPVDLLLDNYFYEQSRGLYGDDITVDSVLFVGEGNKATWEDYVKPTRKIGQLIDKPQLAEDYINQSLTEVKQAGKRLNERFPRVKKFAVVQFIDTNNLRMYATNSLFNAAFSTMNRELVALDEGNEWGFIALQMGDLTRLDDDACLLVIEPLSPLTENQLADSLVWQRLGYGNIDAADNSRCMAKLPPVWIYGGMASLTNLADNLAAANLVGGDAL